MIFTIIILINVLNVSSFHYSSTLSSRIMNSQSYKIANKLSMFDNDFNNETIIPGDPTQSRIIRLKSEAAKLRAEAAILEVI